MAKLTAVKVRDLLFAIVAGSTNCVPAGLSNSLVSCKQNGFPGIQSKVFTTVTIFCNENLIVTDGIGSGSVRSTGVLVVERISCLVDTLILGLEYVDVLGYPFGMFPRKYRLPKERRCCQLHFS